MIESVSTGRKASLKTQAYTPHSWRSNDRINLNCTTCRKQSITNKRQNKWLQLIFVRFRQFFLLGSNFTKTLPLIVNCLCNTSEGLPQSLKTDYVYTWKTNCYV